MKVAVYDTHVLKKDGGKLHFDVIVPRLNRRNRCSVLVANISRLWVGKARPWPKMNVSEHEFCRVEPATPEIEQVIQQHDYYIQELSY